MELRQALLELEKAAGAVAPHLPDDLDDDALMAMLPAWLPTARGNRDQRLRQLRQWLSWVADCADRWGCRDVEPDAGELILRWARSKQRPMG